MINLGVDDIHAEHNRLSDAGVVFIRPPERESWGGWVATFQDPDGNLLQLLQTPTYQLVREASPSDQTSSNPRELCQTLTVRTDHTFQSV